MILLVDNYDSFTWNVWQALAGLGAEVAVVRNDAASVAELLARRPRGIVLSPGPGRPASAGVMPELLRRAPPALPLLGVCLGHQALVECHGGALERDPVPVHGRASPVRHTKTGLFEDLPSPFEAGRYHSLRASRAQLPACLELTAWTAEGHVMAVRHRELPRFGVQFHPESILSPEGPRIFARFLELCAA
jgi:anthranilate synthase/aminodeoxychorismate synthase-like glutamine amidotransferase